MNCLTNILLFKCCSRPDFGWSGPKRPELKVVWFQSFTVCVKRAGPFEADLMKENLKEVSCRQPIPYLVQVRANLHRKKDVSSGGTTREHDITKKIKRAISKFSSTTKFMKQK